MLRKIAAAIAALGAAGAVLVTAGPAEAARRPVTDTVRITGNYDNGNHGPWAALAYDRKVSISRGATSNTWTVKLTDKGTFRTLRGKLSPEAGAPIANSVSGKFEGGYSFTVVSTSGPTGRHLRDRDFRCDMNGTGDRADDCPGMPKPTNEWPALYFGDDAVVTPGSWRWDYRTCKERWVTSNAGDTGDITGRPCVETVTPAAPVVHQPTCTARQASITVPAVTGVRWTLKSGWHSWSMQSGHAYTVAAGRYRVEADAQSGYRFQRHVRDSWAFTINRAPWNCPTPTPTPSPTPSETVSPA